MESPSSTEIRTKTSQSRWNNEASATLPRNIMSVKSSSLDNISRYGRWNPSPARELAERFPGVRFIAMGRANDESMDRALRRKYVGSTNVEMSGFISGERKNQVLEEAWILVNTSVSEGFPVSFPEAAAHGCAILSPQDPEGFSSRFEYHVGDGDLDAGLSFLLASDRWRRKGEEGYAYVSEFHEKGRVVDSHLAVYEGLMGS